MEKRRIVITGIGMITPLGLSAEETWRRLIQGKSGITRLTRFDPDKYGAASDPSFPRIAGEVKEFDLTQWGVDKKTARRLDPFSQFALAAAIEALSDSQINPEKENPFKVGVSIGSCLGGIKTWGEQFLVLLEEGTGRVSPFFVPMLMPNSGSGAISIHFGLKGPNITNSTACATGAHAIGLAAGFIELNQADLMVCGGAEAPLVNLTFAGFNQLKALSRRNDEPEKASRPFDSDRDGFVMGEGAGVIVLEELYHALKRKAVIYAELAGFAATGDAFHVTEPSVEGPRECMRLALKNAGISPEEVAYINAHGTSTFTGDINETKAIKTLFGEHARKLAVSSTKSMTGHLLGAAGAVEAIITVLSIKDGIIPPTINLDKPDPECDLDYVPREARKANVGVAISNSFGFGGTNATLVFKKFNKEDC